MEAATDFPDGIWFVQLAPLDEAEQVATVVALTLDLREAPDEPLVERIIAFLGSRHALLVLDNCEHVLSGCAELADGCSRLLSPYHRDQPYPAPHRRGADLAHSSA
ncbi:MAG: hypothetical protein M9890_07945 [Thermomicrobiales bacterium]|nr:hypothetical protein [Thermomicrobiales bacterium]